MGSRNAQIAGVAGKARKSATLNVLAPAAIVLDEAPELIDLTRRFCCGSFPH
jgi:hypothetical protein